ncbi:MAG: SEL1-like repeat protein [Candidatus Tectomicrobia bacterium]|nr:SEL1-like repeat protein [Candidatus Tectomicrobia bacterium]
MQGYAWAQYGLGFMYNYGRGVPESDVEAYAWVNIAADQGVQLAKKVREPIAETMTRENMFRAQKLSREYWKAYVLPFRD